MHIRFHRPNLTGAISPHFARDSQNVSVGRYVDKKTGQGHRTKE